MIIAKPLTIKQPQAGKLIRDQAIASWSDSRAISAITGGYLLKYQPMGKYDGDSITPCYAED